jgi:hypothetical protein
MEIEQAKKEAARWIILRVLDAGRPVGCNGSLILTVLDGERLLNSPSELRRELDYLADRGLVAIEQDDNDETSFAAKLTAMGVDVVEYTAPAPAGIARPKKGAI